MSTVLALFLAAGLALAAVALWLWLRPAGAAAAAAVPPAKALVTRVLLLWYAWLAYVQRLRLLVSQAQAARYRQSWVLLLGEPGAGKSSLVASLARVREHAEARAAVRPGVPGTAWHLLPQGVLIDPSGLLSAAPAGTPEAAQWRDVLLGISAQRPERALDGVLLAVSAASLRDGDEARRLQLARDARRQLQELRAQLGLALPVYVVVTQCDRLEGFGAYWRAFPAGLRTQMQGWAAPGGLRQAGPAEWLEQAWDELLQRLQRLQADAAGVQPQLAEADAFFLYPRRFDALRQRMHAYLAEVFQDGAWEQAFLCRGIWFTGNVQPPAAAAEGVRADVAFVDHLVADKVLRERGLARVTERTAWSRDRTVRSLQQAGVALAVAASLLLAVQAIGLEREVDQLAGRVLQLRQEVPVAGGPGACIGKPAIDEALRRGAALDPRLARASMPLSWLDPRPRARVVRGVSDAVMARTVLPAISCSLQDRAKRLADALPQAPQVKLAGIVVQGSDYARLRTDLLLQGQAVQDLERNFRRFDRLWAVPSDPPAARLGTLDALAAYLYGSGLPPAALAHPDTLGDALDGVAYPRPLPLPERLRAHFARQLEAQAAGLHAALLNEVAAGPTLLARLAAGTAPMADNATRFAAWLNWVSKQWLPSDPDHNPCTVDAREVAKLLRPLVDAYQYPTTLLAELGSFEAPTCYRPALNILQAMHMAPYGPLAVSREGQLVLNPDLAAEVRGFSALTAQTYMQVSRPQPFECVPSAPGWRTVDIGRAEGAAREYQQFMLSQSLAPLGTVPARQPLFLRVAARQLELVMNDALRSAQGSAGAPDILRGLTSVSAGDQQMLEQSNDFARALQPLLATLRVYHQLGFRQSATLVSGCARGFAGAALARITSLADQSRLYEPAPGTPDGPLLGVGPLPVARDYLGRQLARAQVLAGYAEPFATLMRNSEPGGEAQADPQQTLAYWTHTIRELNRYVQFKEPAGEVAVLEALVLKGAGELTYANCGKQLADLRAPGDGHDLFSTRRRELLRTMRGLCANRTLAIASDAYQRLAARFNAELSQRYPFAPPGTRQEAALGTAKAFFIDHDAQRPALAAALSGVDPVAWKRQLDFVAQLDKAAAFLRGSLTATPASQPLHMALAFRVQPDTGPASTGANQVVGWTLSAGPRVVSFPGLQPPSLEWPFGEALELTLNWADRSQWRPVALPGSEGLQVDGTSASFASGGEWALLRMIERFHPRPDPRDPASLVLEFSVPVRRVDAPAGSAPRSDAVLYLGIGLSAGGKAPVAWPGPFPRVAPPAPAVLSTSR